MSDAGKYEPTQKDKIAIIENNIRGICRQIYDLVIAGRVANKIGNQANIDKAQKALEELEKTKQAYEEELKAEKE